MATRGRPIKISTFIQRMQLAAMTQLSLNRLLHNGALGQKVERFKLDPSTSEYQAMGESILQIAQDDTDGLGQKQNYVLRADAAGEQGGQFTFSCTPEVEDGESADRPATEPATRDGLAAQLMRHLENRDRLLVSLVTEFAASEQRKSDMIERVMSTMSKGFVKGLEAQSELASKQGNAEADLAIRLAEMEERNAAKLRKDEMIMEAVKLLGPVVQKSLNGLAKPESEGEGGN